MWNTFNADTFFSQSRKEIISIQLSVISFWLFVLVVNLFSFFASLRLCG